MNQNEMLLLKLGEVVLKGLNRRSFEDKLVSNVRRRMKPCGSFQIYIRQSTIYVEPQTETCDMEAAYKAARQIFGVVTVARAVPGDVRNNMCYAWMMGAAKLGMHFVAMGPEELAKQMDQEVVQSTFAEARKNGGLIEITDHMEDLKGADVIYGDVWASMGEEAQIPERVGLLSPFRVTMDTLKATENPDVLYLHCLPSFHDFETKMAKEWQAKGVDIREVTDEVFRSHHSVVFDEAENRMHSIKAVMVATIGA